MTTYYQNDGGTIRAWTEEDAIRGSRDSPDEDPDGDAPFWWVVLTHGDYRMVVREGDLKTRVQDEDCETWTWYDPRHRGVGVVEAEPADPYGPLQAQVSPRKASDLKFEQISGTGSRKTVNAFLDHPALVSHGLGDVTFWTAAFVARSPVDDSIVGAVVLHRPAARALDDGSRIEVRRLATRADRPMNTASWMLARAARWAGRNGYETIQAYAGFAGNRGVCYDAAGFDCVKEDQVPYDRDDWNSADGRDGRVHVRADGGQQAEAWTRRRWERALD